MFYTLRSFSQERTVDQQLNPTIFRGLSCAPSSVTLWARKTTNTNICYISKYKKLPPAPPPRTRSSRKHVLLETLQSVQSVELFNFNRAPTARERHKRQGTPRSAWERFGAPANAKLPFFATPDAPRSRKCLIFT